MGSPKLFQDILVKKGFTFYSGIPDSTLMNWLEILEMKENKESVIRATNEGQAISICAGHYLSTGEAAVTYMQNSGLGNCVNPLTSLCDNEVYSIPVLLIIGWRGEPGKHDEPQHIKMGKITLDILEVLGIKYSILGDNSLEFEEAIDKARCELQKNIPYALVVKEGVFDRKATETLSGPNYPLSREETISKVIAKLNPEDIIVSTTGKISRELYECRESNKQGHNKDFYTVGSMGHSSSIALGLSFNIKGRIIVLDGDGAVLMHMGSLATIGHEQRDNFYHIVLDNESYESTGRQPCISKNVNICAIAKSCGYRTTEVIMTKKDFNNKFSLECPAPAIFVIKVDSSSRKDLGRPRESPQENKIKFMENAEYWNQ